MLIKVKHFCSLFIASLVTSDFCPETKLFQTHFVLMWPLFHRINTSLLQKQQSFHCCCVRRHSSDNIYQKAAVNLTRKDLRLAADQLRCHEPSEPADVRLDAGRSARHGESWKVCLVFFLLLPALLMGSSLGV